MLDLVAVLSELGDQAESFFANLIGRVRVSGCRVLGD